MKVAHITTVHKRHDVRIFFKECTSLVTAGYDVYLVVADGLGDDIVNGVNIIDIGLPRSRFHRVYYATKLAYDVAMRINADIYHAHDPELLPLLFKLKKKGKLAVFDSHEDVYKQLLNKSYIPRLLRMLIAKSYSFLESFICSRIDGVVCATESIQQNFARKSRISENINNYPILNEGAQFKPKVDNEIKSVCFVGTIEPDRGIVEVMKAISLLEYEVKLNLSGSFSSEDFKSKLSQCEGWNNVVFHGWLDRVSVDTLIKQSSLGLVTLHPMPNFIEALPVKMFEYMRAGVPVLSSNFPLWKEIIAGNNCGLCVDPLSPQEIATAIDSIISNPDMASEMGNNGLNAVTEKYNWSREESKLFNFYRKLQS
ncbi:glycosyltransferase [Aeromonas salmonicida]|uniref:glycosyltransferase n=1 Tax=Aeromonas salmonicida TaxID=645 RepID=UPI00279647E5|nr:glycosyltransferase [Aeromonas salmonicida]MDQ1882876.1 glycosyltransferase [Aeromonas salmonicida]